MRALIQVVLGASLVVLHTSEAMEQVNGGEQPVHQFLLGIGALVSAYSISGLNCVYMEKVLKGSGDSKVPTNIWHKNVQLAVFGLIFALIMMLVRDRQSIALDVFLAEGHGLLYWLAVILGAIGGLLVAFALKFTDAMLKSFAQSVAVIIKTIMSAIIFRDVTLGFYFFIGGCNVALGVTNYNAGGHQAKQKNRLGSREPKRVRVVAQSHPERAQPSRGGEQSTAYTRAIRLRLSSTTCWCTYTIHMSRCLGKCFSFCDLDCVPM